MKITLFASVAMMEEADWLLYSAGHKHSSKRPVTNMCLLILPFWHVSQNRRKYPTQVKSIKDKLTALLTMKICQRVYNTTLDVLLPIFNNCFDGIS